MAIEGTGIKTPSKESSKKATAFLGGFQKKADEKFIKTYEQKQEGGIRNSDFETNRYNKLKQKYGDQFSSDARSNYFSPGGGAFDERNNVQIASASNSFDESDYKGYLKAVGIKNPKGLSPMFNRLLRENYQIDKKEGIYKDGQIFNRSDTLLNKAPVKEKPSFVEQTKNLAGSIFNAVTGTQPAAASQIPGGMPTGTQFTSSNLDAARAPTGDTSFASYRMAGQPSGGEQQQQGSGIVTPFSQTSMGKGEGRKVTPFSETSMGQRVSVAPTTTPKTVTIDGQTVAARQTVASLPSDYKQTEAREFAKAAAFKEAQGIAKRNPNVKVGVDSKGQPRATAVQKTRSEAGPSARTAQGNQARVKQNAQARAQAAAVNRKLSGTKPKSAKQRAQDAAKARKAAGPNRKMSAGQVTRSQAGASARTAQGNRARVKSNARKRARAAARKRRAKKKGKKGKK